MLVTLPLYIFKELLKAFGMSILVYSFALLGVTAAQAIREGATLLTVLGLLPSMFPLISPLALPLAVITAILICYGRFSANNEFVGSQASGVHPGWLAMPALILALLCSIVTVYLNADVLTSSVGGIEKALFADKTKIISKRIKKPGSFAFPISDNESLAICRLPDFNNSDKIGIDFTVFKQGAKENSSKQWDTNYPYPETRILAKNHNITVQEDNDGSMYIEGIFDDASEFVFADDTLQIIDFPHGTKKLVIPKSGINFTIDKSRTQYMGIDKLKLEMDKYNKKYYPGLAKVNQIAKDITPGLINNIKQNPLAMKDQKLVDILKQVIDDYKVNNISNLVEDLSTAYRIIQSKQYILSEKIQSTLNNFMNLQVQNNTTMRFLRKCLAEINSKLVMSFACISFAILGIPIGLMGKRKNIMLGYAMGGGFAFAFYMIITAVYGAVRDGGLPWYALWTPNIFVLAIGLFLWFKNMKNLS